MKTKQTTEFEAYPNILVENEVHTEERSREEWIPILKEPLLHGPENADLLNEQLY